MEGMINDHEMVKVSAIENKATGRSTVGKCTDRMITKVPRSHLVRS
jgi:hypothetical protein